MSGLIDRLLSDQLRLVKDDKYGSENPNVTGGWDGVIGELVRKVTLKKTGKTTCETQ